MSSYILRRVLQTIIVTIVLSYVCFNLMTLMPGDPVDLMIQSNPRIKVEDVVRLRALYGLDQPSYKRYWNWVKTIAGGDLGYSRTYRIPVGELMGPKLVNTFILAMTSLVLALLISLPLGILSALKPGSKFDYWSNFFSFTGISMPSFWLGIMLMLIFSVHAPPGWKLPSSGTYTIGEENGSIWSIIVDRGYYLILPTISLAYQQIGRFMRFTRASMVEAMRNDYIRTAKAKGLGYWQVVWKHGFRNALIPLITILALSISSVFSGALITESIFAYQGVGKLAYDSIIANDFNVAMLSFMITVIMTLAFNLVADILYGVADPRISYK